MKAYIQTVFNLVLTAASFLEPLDVALRILCGIASLVLFYFALRAHISKKRLHDLEMKIKQEELNDRIRKNGHVK